jgi:hypothetical protein
MPFARRILRRGPRPLGHSGDRDGTASVCARHLSNSAPDPRRVAIERVDLLLCPRIDRRALVAGVTLFSASTGTSDG